MKPWVIALIVILIFVFAYDMTNKLIAKPIGKYEAIIKALDQTNSSLKWYSRNPETKEFYKEQYDKITDALVKDDLTTETL